MAEVRNKTDSGSLSLIAAPGIEKRILVVRGRQVILDEDLADLYGVARASFFGSVEATCPP